MIHLREVSAGSRTKPILHAVSLSIAAGQWLAIVGANGSGKTTLLRVMAGLLRPYRGQVEIAGHPLATLRPRQRAQLLAMVPQRPALLPPMVVEDFVLLGRYPSHGPWQRPSRHDRHLAQTALAEVGAEDLARRLLPSLSAGEVARVLLAQALAQDTPILLLDEAAAHLDPAWTAQLMAVLQRRHQEGRTILMVLHDLNVAALSCSRFLALDAGRVVFDGPREAFFSQDRLEALYATPFHILRHPMADVPQILPLPAPPAGPSPGLATDCPAARGLGRAHPGP